MFDFLKRRKKKVTEIVMVSGDKSVNICADCDVVITEKALESMAKEKQGGARSVVFCKRVELEESR